MKTVARWNPFRELAPFAFPDVETFLREFPYVPQVGAAYEPVPTMRMDLMEGASGYTLKTEMPGMKKEDIVVSIDGTTVSIAAEAKRTSEMKEGDKMLRAERYYGSLSRALTLPYEVDTNKAEATYEDGVLTLVLPKAPGVESKRLTVH
jgi:HSP20 family protein